MMMGCSCCLFAVGFALALLSVEGKPEKPEPCHVNANGYSADDTDCTVFYRCAYSTPFFQANGGRWTARFSCPPGLHFDPTFTLCNWPSLAHCRRAGGENPVATGTAMSCRSLTCQNGGTCVITAGSAVCRCPVRFRGKFCEQDANTIITNTAACRSHVCQNGGTCVVISDTPVCRCPAGLSGSFCEQGGNDVFSCESDPCQNGGSCVPLVGSYFCSCRGGFSGPNCQNDLWPFH
ncbi:hypothetical protein ACOMHN_035690 [Nucella lapillus]